MMVSSYSHDLDYLRGGEFSSNVFLQPNGACSGRRQVKGEAVFGDEAQELVHVRFRRRPWQVTGTAPPCKRSLVTTTSRPSCLVSKTACRLKLQKAKGPRHQGYPFAFFSGALSLLCGGLRT